ncbi:penicillin-binding transpeptidase domain-containing protein [Lachnospiraceae bacterium 62-35]
MFNDFIEIIQDFLRRFFTSRLTALGALFTTMFLTLIGTLFQLQIVNGEQYLNDYIQKTEKTVKTPGTRGRILDKNGNVLAYNELAHVVTIQDTGKYRKSAEKNAMILQLIQILDKHGEHVEGKFEIAINSNGEMVYTASSETARKRFLRDFYGRRSVDDLDDPAGKYPSAITAREAFENKKVYYGLDQMKDDKGNSLLLPDDVALDIINIRYTMDAAAFQKYVTTPITSYVSPETVIDIKEHKAELDGVDIEESTIRVYNDSIYFASIIGYTGKVQEDQLEDLKKKNTSYELTDIVGRIGIEASMEEYLQGTKGERTICVDNMGRIMEVLSESEPNAGQDVYLTLDRDLQKGIYHLIEQQLAGVLTEKIVNQGDEVNENRDSSRRLIPIKDAYFQLINNNVLNMSHFFAEDASEIERGIANQFEASKERILGQIRNELYSSHATPMKDLSSDMYAYMLYIKSYLQSPTVGILTPDSSIDKTNADYLAWRDESGSLRDFIYAGIANTWIDTTKLQIGSKYSNADDIYSVLVEYVLDNLNHDAEFHKKIYRYLINDEVITGRELCLALFDQGVLTYDETQVHTLRDNGDNYAYLFLKAKIASLELTPAQLALDPCTAGCVVTDVNTGEVRAIVTYPSYDNNRLSGTMDSSYYTSLLEDLSNPLYNNATQTVKAPGSTFKPISAIAALQEGVVSLDEKIECTGIYDKISPPIKCWISPGQHGEEAVVEGIQNSCNYFFAELAHRLSTDENDNYVPSLGLEKIRKYASMFGLDHTSGVEISELNPRISTEDPERSVMGQGTHEYANVQLSRYVAALANRGTVYELSLIDKITDSEGTLVKDYTPAVCSHIDIPEATWNAVQQGMRQVITESSSRKIFNDLEVDIAGKTGTAQESNKRGNHAYFISYGPFENPDICVTVNIPYGYSSGNAASLAKSVYRFYYGYTDLDYILNTGALDASNVEIRD